MSEQQREITDAQRVILERFLARQSAAGKKGGRSRSVAKRAAAAANLNRVRSRRHNKWAKIDGEVTKS